jgi:hypothetical protein
MDDLMLFDEILGNSNIKNVSWKNEIEKWLLYIKNKGELDRYLTRLIKMNSRKIYEILAEISSAYLLESILNLKVTSWEVPTNSNKNVDFTIDLNSEEVYCEVKSPSWLSELSEKEKLGNRKVQEKYKKNEVRFFGHWKNISYAIKKAYPKFLNNCKNLVIINDNLFVGILDFPNDTAIKIALYNDSVAYGGIKGVFVNRDYENVGGVLFININPSSQKNIYKYKYIGNPNALKKYTLPNNVVTN